MKKQFTMPQPDLQRQGIFTDAEFPSGLTLFAYRFSAFLLALSVITNLAALSLGSIINIMSGLIDIALVIGLLVLKPAARGFLLFRVIAGTLVQAYIAFTQYTHSMALLAMIVQIGFAAAFIIILTGIPRTWRFIVGGVSFFLLYFFPTWISFLIKILLK